MAPISEPAKGSRSTKARLLKHRDLHGSQGINVGKCVFRARASRLVEAFLSLNST